MSRIRCSTLMIEPSENCYDICVLSNRCGALKEWERGKERRDMSGLISRQAALEWLKTEWDGMVTSVFDGIKQLPSAQPKQGRWMTERYEYGRCSNCRGYAIETENGYYFSDYCPNCGAYMGE